MDIYPNSESDAFCTWLLIQPYIKLTAPQIVVVDEIQTAYAGSTFVSENTWNNFMMFSAKWYQYYLAYVAQTGYVAGKWYNWSASMATVGFSALTTEKCWFTKINKTAFIQFRITGTSNATTLSFTLPFTAKLAVASIGNFHAFMITNNGVALGPAGRLQLTNASANCIIYRDIFANAYTAAGTKQAIGQFFYETET